jgi:glutaminyl-peptide cyclotransferase
VTVPGNGSPHLAAAVFSAAGAESARAQFTLYRREILDDHQPFLDAGLPAVDLIDFMFGSHAGANDYWHTLEDTLDKLSPRSLETVGRVVVRVVNSLAAQGPSMSAARGPDS